MTKWAKVVGLLKGCLGAWRRKRRQRVAPFDDLLAPLGAVPCGRPDAVLAMASMPIHVAGGAGAIDVKKFAGDSAEGSDSRILSVLPTEDSLIFSDDPDDASRAITCDSFVTMW
mmetsp:Transcript_112923/g.315500  ORF Transcript_112923/g.315500 Transcript_112923/m.315500 type:complete len:114 (-) Transcript_112923:123-464(-)